MSRHISEQFDTELDALRSMLMEMGGLVERQIQQSCQALIAHDVDLAEATRRIDDEVNRYEVDIDERVINVIARRQPTASDLRMVICIMKASADLERIGDESDRIAKMAVGMGRQAFPEDQYKHIRTLSDWVTRMVGDVLDAFARNDPEAALAVIATDRQVDQELTDLRAAPEHAQRAINTLWTARALERIGDHAKNIGEQIVFQVRGEDVRHSSKPPPSGEPSA